MDEGCHSERSEEFLYSRAFRLLVRTWIFHFIQNEMRVAGWLVPAFLISSFSYKKAGNKSRLKMTETLTLKAAIFPRP